MEVLKGKRTYIKGQITRIENFAKTIKDDSNLDELMVRLDKINQLYKDFVDVEYQMIELSDVIQTDIEAVDAQYYSTVPKLKSAIRKKTTLDQPQVNLDHTLNTTQSSSSDFRLPRTTIPPFDGNYREWQSFLDLFVSAVHENGNLSPAQKFQYLKGLLRGDALALVRHFPINDSNYIEAYQKLCKRYDKKRYIVDSFIQSYFDQPAITQATSQSVARLHDTCDEVVRGLNALGTQAESREPWLIHIATQKMDQETRQMWKLETAEIEYPTFDKLLSVLNKRMDALQGVKSETSRRLFNKSNIQNTKAMHTAQSVNCAFCSKDHKLSDCTEFSALEIQQRREYVRKHSRCYNCLSEGHLVYQCKSKHKCKLCQKKHHEMLHLQGSSNNLETTTCSHASTFTNAILPTAQIEVQRDTGDWQVCRALLDSGSQTSFVTEECFQRLGLKKQNGRIYIQGLNEVASGVSKGMGNIYFKSRFPDDEYRISTKVLIVPSISSYQPTLSAVRGLKMINSLRLADTGYDKRSKIDILLGSDIFFEILCEGKRYIPNTKLIAHNTKLGWVIGGTPIQNEGGKKEVPVSLHLDVDLSLRKFWEIEEISEGVSFTEKENYCLNHYRETVRRAAEGNYIVRLPFKRDLPSLGNSKLMAVRRLCGLEKRFARDESFKTRYIEFLNEYLHLKHMQIARH